MITLIPAKSAICPILSLSHNKCSQTLSLQYKIRGKPVRLVQLDNIMCKVRNKQVWHIAGRISNWLGTSQCLGVLHSCYHTPIVVSKPLAHLHLEHLLIVSAGERGLSLLLKMENLLLQLSHLTHQLGIGWFPWGLQWYANINSTTESWYFQWLHLEIRSLKNIKVSMLQLL